MTQTRITQEALETVVLPTPATRVTQLAQETVTSPTPPSRLTQLVIETLVSERPRSRVSQLALETIVPNAIEEDLEGVTGQLWPRAGGEYPGIGNTPTSDAGGDLLGTFPNPTVAKIQGTPVSAVAPTNGQALVYNSTSGLYVPTTLAGGSSYDMWDPDKPPTSPDAASLIWSAGATPASATGLSNGSAGVGTTTYSINTDANRLTVFPSPQAFAWRVFLWPWPAGVTGDFTMYSHVRLMVDAVNYGLCGIILSQNNNGTSGRYVQNYVGFNSDSSGGHYSCKFEYGTGAISGFTGQVDLVRGFLRAVDCIVAIRRVGSDYFGEVSLDGLAYSRTGAVASTTLGGGSAFNPAYFGVSFYSVNQQAVGSRSYGPVYIVADGAHQIGGKRTVALL